MLDVKSSFGYVEVNTTLEGANENPYLVMQMPFMWMQTQICMHVM